MACMSCSFASHFIVAHLTVARSFGITVSSQNLCLFQVISVRRHYKKNPLTKMMPPAGPYNYF